MRIKTNNPTKLTTEEYNSLLFGLFNIIFTNDVCTNMVYESLEEIEKAGMMKKTVKYRAKLLRDEIRAYNRILSSILKEREFIADVNDCYEEILSADLAKLELTIKNYMHKCHVPYTDLQCKCAMAYIFAQGACKNVDENIRKRDAVSRYTHTFKRLRLTQLTEALKRTMEELERTFKSARYFCDLNANNDIYNGFVVIVRKLADPKTIVDVVKKYDNQIIDEEDGDKG